jgi:uncharacterized phiE125 gp8 family phage protein
MSLRQSVDSTSEVVTLDEAKQSLRIDHNEDDSYINGLIKASRKWAEDYCQRSFFTQTWVMELDSFPNINCIELLMSPIASVSSIKYYDADNTQQTWDSSNYRVDTGSRIGRIEAVDTWPTTYDILNAVEITYVAGESSISSVDEGIKTAIKIMVGDLYELRQNVIVGSQVNVRNTTEILLNSYKIYYAYK